MVFETADGFCCTTCPAPHNPPHVECTGRESLPPTVQQYALQVDPRQLAGTALLASCWTDDLTGFTDKCHAFDGPGAMSVGHVYLHCHTLHCHT